jgi:hypothetical protein
MDNQRILTDEVEPTIRAQLKREFGVDFTPQALPLRSGGKFNFDAVSSDLKVVASIKSSRGTTRGGKLPSGAVKAAITDLYYLSLVDAPCRFLVVTDQGFYDRLAHELVRKKRVAPGLEIKHVSLPENLAKRVQAVLDRASAKQRSRVDKPGP